MITQMLVAGSAPPAITVDAADFDGTNDHMALGASLSGIADSKSGLFSCWVRLDGGDATNLRIFHIPRSAFPSQTAFGFQRDSTGSFRTTAGPEGSGTNLILDTTLTYAAGATWYHVISSWDLSTSQEHIYVNDVDRTNTLSSNNSFIDYTQSDCLIGLRGDSTERFNGALAELYFQPGAYLDLSITANRRKFISPLGKPVFLGTNGSLPTGTAAMVYLHLDNGETVANFATNRGTGGNFTVTGALATASTSPSD